jgi:hypothetical protein
VYADNDESVTSRSFSRDAGRLPRTSGALPGDQPSKQQLPGWIQSKTAALVPEEISAREEKQRRFFEQQEMRARQKEQAEYRRRWVYETFRVQGLLESRNFAVHLYGQQEIRPCKKEQAEYYRRWVSENR